eukprot:79980-Prymnesium_polylepis.1
MSETAQIKCFPLSEHDSMVRKAVLTPQRDQNSRVRRHGSSTGRGPRFFHTVESAKPRRDTREAGRTADGTRETGKAERAQNQKSPVIQSRRTIKKTENNNLLCVNAVSRSTRSPGRERPSP